MMVLLTEDGGENGLNFEQFLSLVRWISIAVCFALELSRAVLVYCSY